MQGKIIKPRTGPEAQIQREIVKFLKLRDWYVLETHGNAFQNGFPDLYVTHSKYFARWVEVKVAGHFRFTPAQLEVFPKLCANGSGVWIMVAATEAEYAKLWKPANWHIYLSCPGGY